MIGTSRFTKHLVALTSKSAADVVGKSLSKTRRWTSKIGLSPSTSGRVLLLPLRPSSTPRSSSVVTLHSVSCGSRTSSGNRAGRSSRLGLCADCGMIDAGRAKDRSKPTRAHVRSQISPEKSPGSLEQQQQWVVVSDPEGRLWGVSVQGKAAKAK